MFPPPRPPTPLTRGVLLPFVLPQAAEEVEVIEGDRRGVQALGAEEDEARHIEGLVLRENNEELPVGGRLKAFRDRWTFDPWAYSLVSNGLGWKWRQRPPKFKPFFQPSTPYLEEYVKDLLHKRVVRYARSVRFQGRLFHVPKKDSDKLRTILDLSHLNKFIQCDKFQMLTIAQIRTLLPQGSYTASIDLSDAYWHIPISRRFSPYLGFKLGRKAYVFKAVPFGLNIAPRIFTKLSETVVELLRQKRLPGHVLIRRLPDMGCIEAGVLSSNPEVIKYLQQLGFQINLKKSRLTPSQEFQQLDLPWNLKSHKLSLPKDKWKEIARAVRCLR